MVEAMSVARRAMPVWERGGSSTRAARNGRGGRVICSICHGLVEEDAFLQVPCSCDVHPRCALGFVDTIPRARINGASTLTYQVTCPNPALYEVHREVDLQSLLQQIRGVSRSADTAEERAIRARVTAAELHLSRRFTTPAGAVGLSRSAAERGEEDIRGDGRGTIPQLPEMKAPCRASGEHIIIELQRVHFSGWVAHMELSLIHI